MADPFAIAIAAIVILALMGAPIGHTMIVGSILYLIFAGQDLGIASEQFLQGIFKNTVLLAIPLFIFAAELMNAGTLTDRLLRFCHAVVGRFRGGLGHVNVVASIIFSGMSGSAIADAAGMGRVVIDMMTRDGKYSPSYAAAITAASATIGPIIPPSIPMVIYSLVSDASIGYLFLGGILPGLLMGAVLMAMNTYLAKRRGFPVEEPVALRELPGITFRSVPALMMPVVLLVGIYGGIATPTEAAALAAAYAFLISVLLYRAISAHEAYAAALNSARSSGAVGLLIAGAIVFGYVVTIEKIPVTVQSLLVGLELSPLTFILIVNVILLVLGCLLEGTTILLVVVPILIPTAKALGIDLVHFGVMAVVNVMIGLVTPPFGLLLFVVAGITRAPMSAIIRDIWPFIALLIAALFVIAFVPGIVLWVPRMFGYNE